MHKSAGFLRTEMISRRPANIERALQMDRDDGVEIVFRHTVEYLVAQDARIIDQLIDATLRICDFVSDLLHPVSVSDIHSPTRSGSTSPSNFSHNSIYFCLT